MAKRELFKSTWIAKRKFIIDPQSFAKIAEDAKIGCPVSAALTGVHITLDAKLV